MNDTEGSRLDPEQLDRALADPQTRARLARALADELARPRRRSLPPFLAGLASGLVAAVAFLVPSLQDQWTLYKTRSAVERYEQIGRNLLEQGHYQPAEQAFSRALDLSEGHRIDLLEEQLRAHVARINDDVQWPGTVPKDVTESDFLYLLELEDTPDQAANRAATLAVYGAFLSAHKRPSDAEARLREAIEVDPQNAAAHTNLGNLLDDHDRVQEAEREYRRAIALDPEEGSGHFDLALLLLRSGRAAEAEAEVKQFMRLEPDDVEGQRQLAAARHAPGETPGTATRVKPDKRWRTTRLKSPAGTSPD